MNNYERKKQFAKKHARKVKERQQLSKIYHSNDKQKKPWTFTKKLTAFIIANCTVIELYTLVVMWKMYDLSALPTLIAAVIGECCAMISYIVKSTFENTANGIVYEAAMKESFHVIDDLTQDEKDNAVG